MTVLLKFEASCGDRVLDWDDVGGLQVLQVRAIELETQHHLNTGSTVKEQLTDMCVNMCRYLCGHVCRRVCVDTTVDICVDMCVDVCVDMCADTNMDMCVDMCGHV